MKRVILSILISGVFFGAIAQKGQIDVFKELGEGSEYTEYWGIYMEGDKYTGKAYTGKRIMNFTYNAFDKVSAFEMKDETGKVSINHGFGYLVPNHYTQPSVFHIEGHNYAYLYVDGLLYWLASVEDPNNIESFEIKGIYIPEAKGDESAGPKKKMSMKEKIAALKAGAMLPTALTDKDHKAIIKEYLAQMKPVQETATANFTDEIRSEIEAIEKADEELLLKIQAGQRERAKRIAAEREREAGRSDGPQYTIKNNTGQKLTVKLSRGGYKTLAPGASQTIDCKDDVINTIMEGNHTKPGTTVLAEGGTACGTTVQIN